jgi:hypothetical protein
MPTSKTNTPSLPSRPLSIICRTKPNKNNKKKPHYHVSASAGACLANTTDEARPGLPSHKPSHSSLCTVISARRQRCSPMKPAPVRDETHIYIYI